MCVCVCVCVYVYGGVYILNEGFVNYYCKNLLQVLSSTLILVAFLLCMSMCVEWGGSSFL